MEDIIKNLESEIKRSLKYWRKAKKIGVAPDYWRGKIEALSLCLHQIKNIKK